VKDSQVTFPPLLALGTGTMAPTHSPTGEGEGMKAAAGALGTPGPQEQPLSSCPHLKP
jgi:hypothetical protein